MPKKLKGDPWEFSAILSQNFETIEGGPFGKKPKTPRNAEKNERRTLWSRPILYVTRKTSLVVPWENGYILVSS